MVGVEGLSVVGVGALVVGRTCVLLIFLAVLLIKSLSFSRLTALKQRSAKLRLVLFYCILICIIIII